MNGNAFGVEKKVYLKMVKKQRMTGCNQLCLLIQEKFQDYQQLWNGQESWNLRKLFSAQIQKLVVDSFNKHIQDDAELGSILARCIVNLFDIYNNSYVQFSTRG